MVHLLLKIIKLLDMKSSEFTELDLAKIYKTLLKKLRKHLSKVHPDSGGNAEQFHEAHELYEELLRIQDKDSNYAGLKAALRIITDRASEIDAGTYSASSIEEEMRNKNLSDLFNEVIKDMDHIDIPRQKIFKVDISELALHFNKLKYCNMQVTDIPGDGRVHALVKFTAVDKNGEQTEMSQDLYAAYTSTGKYRMSAVIQCEYGEEITVQTYGFDMTNTLDTKTAGVHTLAFRQNRVELLIDVRVYIVK